MKAEDILKGKVKHMGALSALFCFDMEDGSVYLVAMVADFDTSQIKCTCSLKLDRDTKDLGTVYIPGQFGINRNTANEVMALFLTKMEGQKDMK